MSSATIVERMRQQKSSLDNWTYSSFLYGGQFQCIRKGTWVVWWIFLRCSKQSIPNVCFWVYTIFCYNQSNDLIPFYIFCPNLIFFYGISRICKQFVSHFDSRQLFDVERLCIYDEAVNLVSILENLEWKRELFLEVIQTFYFCGNFLLL